MHLRCLDPLTFTTEANWLAQPDSTFDNQPDWFAMLVQYGLPTPATSEIWIAETQSGCADLAILPMRARPDGTGRMSLTSYYSACYQPWVAPGNHSGLTSLLNHWLRDERDTRLDFRPMDPSSPAYLALQQGLRSLHTPCFAYFCHGNWYLPIGEASFRDYLAQRPGRLRQTLARKQKQFRRAGGRLELITGDRISCSRLEQAITAYQAIYAASWKDPEPYPEFMPALIRLCAQRGWLRLGLAWLGEHPIAAQVWIIHNNKASIYKLAYDQDYKLFSPGTLLTAYLMEQAIDKDQVNEVDYLIGDEPYKADWMTHRRERWGLLACNPRTLDGLRGLLRHSAAALIKPR